jgi:epoxyqueuosine reductase
MAVWALARLDPETFEAEREQRQAGESDPAVLEEWQRRDDPAA